MVVERDVVQPAVLGGARPPSALGEPRAGGVRDRLLDQRVKEREADGLVIRTVIPSTPVQIRYALSANGEELMSILQRLVDWGFRHRASGATAARPGS